MEPVNQVPDVEIKACVVQLERLPVNMYDDNDSSDSMDLPSPPNFSSSAYYNSISSRKKTKSKKSSAELLKEHQDLAQNLIVDNESLTNIKETIRILEIEKIENTDDRSLPTPEPVPPEDNSVKILCAKNSLQFFNPRDVTPGQCGYDNRCHDSFPVHRFEKKFLSFKRVEFVHVTSSFLYSAAECCISDCKSFVTFLLRTLSVHSDIDCIDSCYQRLLSLLETHQDSSCLTFSSAEIFMLLFNYGADIDTFKFFSKWTDVKKKLEVPMYNNAKDSAIPSKCFFNLEYMLEAFIKIISTCSFEAKKLEKFIIFLMWLSTDSSLLKEDLYSTVRECIYVCLEAIKEEKWNKTLCNIVNALLSMESSSVHERWTNIYLMSESIPNRGKRGIQLCKQISFSSLKCLCLGLNQDIDEDCLGFHINELQCLIQQLTGIDSNLLKYASKFVDNCTKHLDASKEAYNELCDILKKCEASFSENAQNEKTHFLKIYAKLSIFCGQKVSFHERCSLFNMTNVKSELDVSQESIENDDDDDDDNSPSFSESSDKDEDYIPNLSKGSRRRSTSQADRMSYFSSKENPSNVHIKSEYPSEESCALVTVKKELPVKLLIRKKRSSRSSSGNSLAEANLTINDLNCENEESRPSSEFECELVAKDSGSIGAIKQNNDTVDLAISGPDLVISSFSVEEPEEETIKVKTEPIYDPTPTFPEVEDMNIVDNEDLKNNSPLVSENYVNEDLFMDDNFPLLEICEVKSVAVNNMDSLENSSTLASELLSEFKENADTNINNENPSFIEIPLIEDNTVLPMQQDESEPHIISHDASVLSDPNLLEEKSADKVIYDTVHETITSTSSVKKVNDLDVNEDIVFIKETISPQKLNKGDENEERIPSSIQEYSKTHPEISITPVKNVPSSSAVHENNLSTNQDIVIVEEKTPIKNKSSDIIFLKDVPSPTSVKSSSSPKIKTAAEVSKSPFARSPENNPDTDDIAIVDVILKDSKATTSTETKSSKNIDNHIDNSGSKSVNISPSESNKLQCQEALNSILRQIDIKKNDYNSPCNDALNSVLGQIDISEMMSYVLESVSKHKPLKEHENSAVSNSDLVDFSNKNPVLDDTESLLTKKSVSLLKNENELTIGSSTHSSTIESNLKVEQKEPGELNISAFFRMVRNNLRGFANVVLKDTSLSIKSDCSDAIAISDENKPLDMDNDTSDEGTSRTIINNLIDKLSANDENETDLPSSQNITNNLQDDDVSDVGNNESLEKNKVNYKAQTNYSNVSDISRNSVKSPDVVHEFLLELDVVQQTRVLSADAKQNLKAGVSVCPVSAKSDVNTVNNNETGDQNVNNSSNINNKACPLSLVSTSEESSLKNHDENKLVSCSSIQTFKSSSKENVLPASDQNKIHPTTCTKIILDTLIKSSSAKKSSPKRKRSGGTIAKVSKKACENGLVIKKSTSYYSSPSSQIKRKRSWSSMCENRKDAIATTPKKSSRKYSPMKSPLGAKYSSSKSPKKFFDCTALRQKYKNFNRSVLSKTGIKRLNILKEKLSPENQENSEVESDDSDVIELYVDPKRYSDKDCLIVYESDNIIILDSD